MPGFELRVLFVCLADFRGPTEKQYLQFADQLVRRGHAVTMSMPGDVATARAEPAVAAAGIEIHRHAFRGGGVRGTDVRAAERFAPTVVHALNPRLPVMVAARAFAAATGAKLFVHFEDDEWGLARARPDESLLRRGGRIAARALSRTHPPIWPFATARSLRWAAEADGLDALSPALAEHVEERLGRTCSVVLPAYSPPAGADLKPSRPAVLEPLRDRAVVAYTGGVFGAHEADLRLALRAVGALQAQGRNVGFVHTGNVAPRFDPTRMAAADGMEPGTALWLGYVDGPTLEGVLREASVLVQPGRPTEFNRLRLPAKLPSYLSSGTPTITFAIGAGELLRDREEVLKTHSEDPTELAGLIGELLDDANLRDRLAQGGPRAAERLFDPQRNTGVLIEHYLSHLDT